MDEEGFVAIQCKFYEPNEYLNRPELENFISFSGKAHPGTTRPIFSRRIVVSTTENWSAHAEDLLLDQTIPVSRINLVDLEESGVDWGQFVSPDAPLLLLHRKSLRPYQESAKSDVLEGLKNNSRGKLIMACGTGKTLTGLRIVEKVVPRGGSVLLAVPSITLLVKNPEKKGVCEIHYHDIGDYLSREEKLGKVVGFGSIEHVPWEKIVPNEHHVLDQREEQRFWRSRSSQRCAECNFCNALKWRSDQQGCLGLQLQQKRLGRQCPSDDRLL